jgi:hypothetical protein
MPARHRHHDSTERRKLFTITLESCSRSAGIRVHDAVETVITMSRNMHRGQVEEVAVGAKSAVDAVFYEAAMPNCPKKESTFVRLRPDGSS